MHILLVNRWYPPHSGYGGVSVYNYYLAHALVELGHQVSVIAARWTPDVPQKHKDGDITIYRLLSRHHYRLHRIPVLGQYMRPFQQFIYSLRVALTVRTLELDNPPDIVEFAEVGAEAFCYLTRSHRLPVVVRCQTPTAILAKYYKPEEMPYNLSITRSMEKYCIEHADGLTAPSQNMAEVISREYRVQDVGVKIVPNPVDVNSFASNTDEDIHSFRRSKQEQTITVLHVGRLDRVKGIMVLAQAIPLVVEQIPSVRFVYVGDGQVWRQRLIEYFQEVGVEKWVDLIGDVDQSTLLQYYRCADIAVVPSMNYESFSYTCVEAMASGIPVIASRIGGIPETIGDGIAGILVEPGDAKGLSQAIIKLANRPDLRDKLGAAGKRRARELFDSKIVARQMLGFYRSVLYH